MKHSVVIVDDHSLFAKSLKILVDSFDDFEVVYHATNGKKLLDWLELTNQRPDVILLDINMPVLNGMDTMKVLCERFSKLKVLALSMDDEDETVIKMLRNGAKGYLLKDIDPEVLKEALSSVIHQGFYTSERITNEIFHVAIPKTELKLKVREKEFLKWACTEKTYKEIASEMFLSPKTVDGYREALFEKCNVKSRVGLVLYAIKNNIIEI